MATRRSMPHIEPLTDRQRRAIAKGSALAAQMQKEFGRHGRISDVHTLLEVGEAKNPWPEGATLEQVQRLERVNGWGGPGFNMIREDRSARGAIRLTPRGNEAFERIVGVLLEGDEGEAMSAGPPRPPVEYE